MLNPRFTPFPEIETKRLFLRKMTKDDAMEMFHLRSDEKVMRYIDRDRANTVTDAEILIDRINESVDSNNGIMWGIACKETGNKLIGNIGYWRLIKEHYRAEIGYMLNPGFWGKGIMKEAAEAVIKFGFDVMNLHSIEAHINPSNEASAALLISTGFVKEGYFKEDYFFRGAFHDTSVYSRLK
jgi:ribosomal-protein-alanine N-acetyltransferase